MQYLQQETTAVGPDKLHYTFFRQLPESTLNFILLTLNDLWSKHIFPGSMAGSSGNTIAKTRERPEKIQHIIDQYH